MRNHTTHGECMSHMWGHNDDKFWESTNVMHNSENHGTEKI